MQWAEIPCIDIDPIVTDRKSAIAREAGRQFAQVAKDYGFVTVRNHGIDAELISKVVQQADLFFNTDQDYRNQFIVDNEDYGYFPAARDGKEGLDIRIRGISWPDDKTGSLDGKMDNVMPDKLPEFADIITQYIRQVSQLGAQLLDCIGEANNFGDAFSRIMPGHRSFLRLNYYPRRETAWTFGEEDGVPLNCVEHFDSGLITLLYQDEVGGLELQRPDTGEWVAVPPQPNTFIINTGRAMERITNSEARATKHRVRFTKNVKRFSLPYFYQPNPNALIWPFGVDDETKRLHAPVQYLTWYNTEIRKNFPEYAQRK